jgi:DNA invertase Pin-like site-specific DNA recombinase
MDNRQVVIYCRFSTDMQNPKSCADQERDVRTGLAQKGINATDALVIHEEAESGTRSDRSGFEQLVQMVAQNQRLLLAVDDQSRLSRADNAFSFITDLVFVGGRFISTGEGIDTDQLGWELRVKVMELHNSTTIRELGRRVHRGQLGRVLDDKSTGDICFGYESYFLDPNWAEKLMQFGRGPKPVKGVRIVEDQARWIRQIFEWFAIQIWSINRIARELTRLKVAKGTKSRREAWHHHQVRRILENPKYVGQWTWGATRTLRNSKGKVKRIPVPEQQKAVRERPHLRIVDQDVWQLAQKRLAALKVQFGMKAGQKRRGPRVHHSVAYPQGLLRGLMICAVCKRRLWQVGRGNKFFLMCPDHGHGPGLCPMCASVPVKQAEEAILKWLGDLLLLWPEWISRAVARMRETLDRHFHAVPEHLAADKRRLVDLQKTIELLLNDLEDPIARQSKALRKRLAQREAEAIELARRVEEQEQVLSTSVEIPDEAWIREQLQEMAGLLREEKTRAALLLRQLIGSIEASAVVSPGKKRGFARLTFRVRAWDLLRAALDGRIPGFLADVVGEAADSVESPEFTIDLGRPGRMEEWAPKIAELREQGVPWKDIVNMTGLGLGPAYEAWKRYVRATKETPGGPQESVG